MKHWYKILGSILLLYVAIFSLSHPLKPSLVQVDVSALRAGYNRIAFTGYYTHFNESKTEAGITVGNHFFTGDVQVQDNNHLAVTFDLPDSLVSTAVVFRVHNQADGELALVQAMGMGDIVVDTKTDTTQFVAYQRIDTKPAFGFPDLPIIYETIRNLNWHVPMWFTMFFLMIVSFVNSIKLLNVRNSENHLEDMLKFDIRTTLLNEVGLVFCILGLITGSLWARYTWGDWWTRDPQLNGALVVFLVYAGYFVLRASVEDADKRARISAVFNLFAFVLMFVLLMVMPRFASGLHPGKGGNPAFSQYDLDSSLRTVFYPAVLGWVCLGYWMYNVRLRAKLLKEELKNLEN